MVVVTWRAWIPRKPPPFLHLTIVWVASLGGQADHLLLLRLEGAGLDGRLSCSAYNFAIVGDFNRKLLLVVTISEIRFHPESSLVLGLKTTN